jgi:hypothetical protein
MIELGEKKTFWFMTDDYTVAQGDARFQSGRDVGWRFFAPHHAHRDSSQVFNTKEEAMEYTVAALEKHIAYYTEKLRALK